MRLVLFTHPPFLPSQSMPRFADMLAREYTARGILVEKWSPAPLFHRLSPDSGLSKWLGYIDQYIIFPFSIRRRLVTAAPDTLFVFCDQALGPWVPWVSHRPHVVHCHDFLALRSALGLWRENPMSWSGVIYQKYIRRGFQKAQNFISVSEKTKHDLHQIGQVSAKTSEVVYNGLAYPYKPIPLPEAERIIKGAGLPPAPSGMLLHVGGGQWYKNTAGVIQIYAEYCRQQTHPLPLWIIGPPPKPKVVDAISQVPANGKVLFFRGISDTVLAAVYSTASLFLFPSFAEGFGWPIVEAQACGCPVLTTNEPPMNEVGGPAAHYIPRLTSDAAAVDWAKSCVETVLRVLNHNETQRQELVSKGLDWARRFDAPSAIDRYLEIYRGIAKSARTDMPRREQGWSNSL